MSSIIVTTKTIDDIKPHPNAERLELAIVGGWQTVVGKGHFQPGAIITYVPPDCIVPDELAQRWGVAKYLSNGRVRAVKLRGEPSYGFVVPPEGEIGRNVAEELGITKYQPPMKFSAGDSEAEHPAFAQYTDVENMRHFPEVFAAGETVVVSEKIHGTNSRIALVRNDDGTLTELAGSRTMQRTCTENSVYWFPWSVPGVRETMYSLATESVSSVILFGEVYGKVQSMRYGKPNGLAFAAFDVQVNGRYWSHPAFESVCAEIPRVPVLATVPYELATVAKLAKGRSLIEGADHIREGVVVRPMAERYDPKTGRVILKYVSDDYLCGDYDAASE